MCSEQILDFPNPFRLKKLPRLLDLTNNDTESECLTSEHTSRIEIIPEKRSHINKVKSGECGSSISLNQMKENHKLSVK